ncbi:tubulin binding cofactor A [Durotheca rogersii]|uniref:tubulin binding cofactor A n=1 Tax=Durotheca rogersii TaxID=419775 RepID=UPI00221EA362|nr:tubulin binding cofactor A [Durotheca rogersii]KAI5862224.1 tubulin binding cofactor A [Durotheca rogersii]
MPAPGPLVIATQSVQRLVKEDGYYRKELAQQSERVEKLEAELKESTDGNASFVLKQEQKALEETKAVFAPLRKRIVEAVQRLEEQIAAAESEGAPPDEIKAAKDSLELGKGVEAPAT